MQKVLTNKIKAEYNYENIDRDFDISKSAFKRAIGRIYKERRVVINEDSIDLLRYEVLQNEKDY